VGSGFGVQGSGGSGGEGVRSQGSGGSEPLGVSPGSLEAGDGGRDTGDGVRWLAFSRDAESAERSAGARKPRVVAAADRVSERLDYVGVFLRNSQWGGGRDAGLAASDEVGGEAWDAAWEAFGSAIDDLL
jgi:hypothetical protein